MSKELKESLVQDWRNLVAVTDPAAGWYSIKDVQHRNLGTRLLAAGYTPIYEGTEIGPLEFIAAKTKPSWATGEPEIWALQGRDKRGRMFGDA